MAQQTIKTCISEILERIVFPIVQTSRFLVSVYYLLLNRGFAREQKAILAGRFAYRRNLNRLGKSCVLLRRNIHRLEKGIVMRPRRNSFAEDYIRETIDVYQRAVLETEWCQEERKWCTDVLREYFALVQDTPTIAEARGLFKKVDCGYSSEGARRYTPYSFKELPKASVSFEDLDLLFKRRRSVRWFLQREVPHELIIKAVDSATFAPSACNRQPYTFYVSADRDRAFEMISCAGGTHGWRDGVSCTIAVVGDLSAYPFEKDRHLIYIDAALASMQLILALETLGLSSCAVNWPDIDKAEVQIKNILGLEDYQRPVMLIAVGYALEEGGIPFSQKKKSDLLVKWI